MFLRIKVFPESKQNKLIEVSEGKYEAYVKDKAEKNAANRRLLTMLKDAGFKNPKIIAGHRNQNKIIEILN